MKRTILFFVALFLTTFNSNAQIPNSGFENWNSFSGYMEPQGWATTNPSGMYTVTQSTDHFPASIGNYSAKIECDTSYNYACAFLMTNSIGDPHPAFPISGHPTSFTGYYKFFSLNNDSMFIRIQLFMNGNIVSEGQFYQISTVSDWDFFNIQLSPYTNADSGCVVISTSNLIQSNSVDSSDYICRPNGNSIVYVDNLNFDNLITSVSDQSALNHLLNIYPNPASDIISLDIDFVGNSESTEVNIFNLTGKLVKSEILNQDVNQVDISNLSNGIYVVSVKTNNLIENQKLIIQR